MTRAAFALAIASVLGACGPGTPTLAERGREIAGAEGCLSCHSTDGTAGTAPTWKGLYLSEVELSDGTTVTSDEAYLRESMLQPSARTVKGYPEGLMETVIRPDSLSDAEVEALIAYIKSLR